MSLFAVPMDARTCHFHRTVGYLENGCRKIRISSQMMMVMRRMMMMMMLMMMVMMTRHCEGAAAWRDSPGIWREFPLRGGRGGSLSPGRSRIRGPARPFASQSKTQGSPLGGYLSWLYMCNICAYIYIERDVIWYYIWYTDIYRWYMFHPWPLLHLCQAEAPKLPVRASAEVSRSSPPSPENPHSSHRPGTARYLKRCMGWEHMEKPLKENTKNDHFRYSRR